ncbi:hypothetical protein ACSBR1_039463 [Camellia fascicularis]
MRKKQGLGMPCQVWINRKTKEKYPRERISCSFSKEEHDAFIQETSALSSSDKKCNNVSCSNYCREFRCLNTYIGHLRPCDRSKWICYSCSCNCYRNCCW